MGWWEYVERVTGHVSQSEIARRLGIAPSSVNRWKSSAPKPDSVRSFAVTYGRPVAEAFVAAGYMQPDDIKDAREPSDAPGRTGPISTEDAAEAIWALKALPEATRRLLILEQLERNPD